MLELNKIICGDAIEELKKLEENSVDSIVTDPPYGISFMGKKWDYDIPSVELWEEVLRVLKPGGHLLSACGTRTYHRMAVNIEDAGFEIRDIISYLYGSGFPKSLNVFKQLKKNCTCGNMEAYGEESKTLSEHELRPMREADLSQTLNAKDKQGEVLQSGVSQQSPHNEGQETVAMLSVSERRKESSVEGRDNLQKGKRKLQRSNLSEVSEGVLGDGEKGQIHITTPISNGNTSKKITKKNGSGTPHRPQSEQQQHRKPCAFCEQWGTQATRTQGQGTALKPSQELWTLARKPLSEKTVAENVLKWGAGGINIDGCRVGTTGARTNSNGKRSMYGGNSLLESKTHNDTTTIHNQGRFPANFIHDGSEEVVSGFPDSKGMVDQNSSTDLNVYTGNAPLHSTTKFPAKRTGFNDSGSASRFFYCAKASKAERNKGLEGFEEKRGGMRNASGRVVGGQKSLDTGDAYTEDRMTKNNHPTVKPLSLMRYLIKLITPPKGIVLDPFVGSGSTCVAAKQLNYKYIGIDREEEYVKIAEARLKSINLLL